MIVSQYLPIQDGSQMFWFRMVGLFRSGVACKNWTVLYYLELWMCLVFGPPICNTDPRCTWFLWSTPASSSWRTGPTCKRSEWPRRWRIGWERCRDRQRTPAHRKRHEWPPSIKTRIFLDQFRQGLQWVVTKIGRGRGVLISIEKFNLLG